MSDLRLLQISFEKNDAASHAQLSYNERGPLHTVDDGAIAIPQNMEYMLLDEEIHVDTTGDREKQRIKSPIKVKAVPCLMAERSFILDGSRPEPLYPPSTSGWFSRIAKRGRRVTIFLHEMAEEKGYWLSIWDTKAKEFLEAHPILPFEKGILEVSEETDEYNNMFRELSSASRSEAEKWIDNVLSGAPPDWYELSQITNDVYVPGLRIGSDMKSTLDLLVPKSFDSDARTQVMAFLGAIVKGHQPNEDPVSYFEKFQSKEVLRTLLMGHLDCVLSGEQPPSYVRIMQESSLQRAGTPVMTVSESLDADPWHRAYYKIYEGLLKTFDTALKYSEKLNSSGKLILNLPVTRAQAAKSRKRWIERFKLLTIGIRPRSLLRPSSLGLIRVAYTGFAHQWPTLHMRWSATIGSSGYRQPSVQIMEMPPDSLEVALRARPSLMRVDWTGNAVNESLYDNRSENWKIPVGRIMRSLDGKRTLRRLGNEFGAWRGSKTYSPTEIWAKALDATSNLLYLSDLEQEKYVRYRGLSRSQLHSALDEMMGKGIIDTTYFPVIPRLMMVAVIAQGHASNVCSLGRAFMKYSPTATVHLAKKGEWLLALSRQPTSTAHHLIATLPAQAAERGIALRCNRLTSFRSYTWSFYRRLLKEDGSWENDVTHMLSQIRVPYQDENAEDD
ncbi:MAG: hypothetical protein ACFFEU_03035 [Candidatus Thorarchaeota archaeon]